MLVLSRRAATDLDALARPGFALGLREELADKYPQFLPRFPLPIQMRIVFNMLDRAERWGLNLQSSLTAYCEFMIVIAGNFDEEAEIGGVLKSNLSRLNLLVPELPEFVSEEAWDRAQAQGSCLPFFVSPSLGELSTEQLNIAALPIALGDRPEAGSPEQAIGRAAAKSKELGLTADDAPLVLAACSSFYGPDPDWLSELVRDGLRGRALLEAIRFRLALDHGRWI